MNVLSVTGGKGGIGKTTISINLSLALAKKRQSVLLFDADLGLANIDIMLNIQPEKNLNDYLTGKASFDEICVEGPRGIRVIPGSSGIEEMANLPKEEVMKVIQGFSTLSTKFDIMLTDLAAGISQQNINLTLASQDIILVICDEPASLMDSYAIIKILHQNYSRSRFGIIVNKSRDLQSSYDTFTRFQDVCEQFMSVSMNYLGHVPFDDYVVMASKQNQAVIDAYPFSPASKAYENLARSILTWLNDTTTHGGIQYFYENLVDPENIKGEKCGA